MDASGLEELATALPIGQQHLPLRKVVAVGVGNALELYDFLTFSFFAIQIGHCFFPQSQTMTSSTICSMSYWAPSI